MIPSIILEASPAIIIGGLIVCMFVVPFLISCIFSGIKDNKNEGTIIFWLFMILAVIIIIATVKECSGFDIPFQGSRHT